MTRKPPPETWTPPNRDGFEARCALLCDACRAREARRERQA